MILFHSDTEPAEDVILGRLYVIPPGEPTEVEDGIGSLILKHKHMHGIVEVRAQKSAEGIKFDLAAAKRESAKKLDAADKLVVEDYIRIQLEDRLRRNYPALPPEGRTKRVLERRGVDLARYGIRPVGMEPVESAEVAALRRENGELREQIAAVVERLDRPALTLQEPGRKTDRV